MQVRAVGGGGVPPPQSTVTEPVSTVTLYATMLCAKLLVGDVNGPVALIRNPGGILLSYGGGGRPVLFISQGSLLGSVMMIGVCIKWG